MNVKRLSWTRFSLTTYLQFKPAQERDRIERIKSCIGEKLVPNERRLKSRNIEYNFKYDQPCFSVFVFNQLNAN